MSEYIITDKQLKTATEAHSEREIPLPITEVFVSGDKLPEIVRCRDCKRVTIDQGDHDYREPLWCGLFRIDVSLDGFCAWAERRDA